MHLVADIGNTFLKLAVFADDRIIEQWTADVNDIACVEHALQKYPTIKSGVLSTVAAPNSRLNALLPWLILDADTALPFENGYGSPKTLGMDRIAAVAGAQALYPHKDVLVIDLGTCIKYNLILKSGVFKGGAISPGIRMRFKALNTFTDRLPLLDTSWPNDFCAASTDASLQSGVLFGALFEMIGMVDSYKHDHPSLLVLLTGGDAALFEDKLKMSIFVHPELNLIGLHSILKNHVAQR